MFAYTPSSQPEPDSLLRKLADIQNGSTELLIPAILEGISTERDEWKEAVDMIVNWLGIPNHLSPSHNTALAEFLLTSASSTGSIEVQTYIRTRLELIDGNSPERPYRLTAAKSLSAKLLPCQELREARLLLLLKDPATEMKLGALATIQESISSLREKKKNLSSICLQCGRCYFPISI